MAHINSLIERILKVALSDSKVGSTVATLLKMVNTNAGVPSNGTAGTLAGIAPKGALLIDTTNAALYQNTNTQASPTWTAIP